MCDARSQGGSDAGAASRRMNCAPTSSVRARGAMHAPRACSLRECPNHSWSATSMIAVKLTPRGSEESTGQAWEPTAAKMMYER